MRNVTGGEVRTVSRGGWFGRVGRHGSSTSWLAGWWKREPHFSDDQQLAAVDDAGPHPLLPSPCGAHLPAGGCDELMRIRHRFLLSSRAALARPVPFLRILSPAGSYFTAAVRDRLTGCHPRRQRPFFISCIPQRMPTIPPSDRPRRTSAWVILLLSRSKAPPPHQASHHAYARAFSANREEKILRHGASQRTAPQLSSCHLHLRLALLNAASGDHDPE